MYESIYSLKIVHFGNSKETIHRISCQMEIVKPGSDEYHEIVDNMKLPEDCRIKAVVIEHVDDLHTMNWYIEEDMKAYVMNQFGNTVTVI